MIFLVSLSSSIIYSLNVLSSLNSFDKYLCSSFKSLICCLMLKESALVNLLKGIDKMYSDCSSFILNDFCNLSLATLSSLEPLIILIALSMSTKTAIIPDNRSICLSSTSILTCVLLTIHSLLNSINPFNKSSIGKTVGIPFTKTFILTGKFCCKGVHLKMSFNTTSGFAPALIPILNLKPLSISDKSFT